MITFFKFLFVYYRDDGFIFYEKFVKTSTTNFLLSFGKCKNVYKICTFKEFVIAKTYINKYKYKLYIQIK